MRDEHGSAELSTVWLRVFLEVARQGSFTSAARNLGWTQSAVSRQVASLERALRSGPLFERLPRGVRPTEAGRVLMPYARAVGDSLAGALRELGDLRAGTGGRLRFGAFASADVSLVPRALARFRVGRPGVVVSREEGFTAGLLERVGVGELDVAVVSVMGGAGGGVSGARGGVGSVGNGASGSGGGASGSGGGASGSGGGVSGLGGGASGLGAYELLHLLDEFLYAALPVGHPLAAAPELRLSQLADADWISGRPQAEGTLLDAALRQGFRPRVAHVVGEWTAKQGYVAAGLGVALVPALAVESVRRDVALVRVVDEGGPARGVYAATARGRAVPAVVGAFVEVLREEAAGLLEGAGLGGMA